MKRFISYVKMSKKQRKRVDKSNRRTWSDFGIDRPVTRAIENKKRKSLLQKSDYMKEFGGSYDY